jgi:4-aminobutyrate aminotransferase-like enzyme
MSRLRRGDLLPRIVSPPPGPEARRLSALLARYEAPGINTLVAGAPSLLWEEARGANVLDVDGNVYLDLTSGFGVATVGHRHPRVVAAVRRQTQHLLHGLGDVHAHPLRPPLARRLVELAPVTDGHVYFAISGSDAVEIALKTSLLSTGRPGILAFEPAYHGLTLGALAVTSRQEFRLPFATHLHGHVHRLAYGSPPALVEETLVKGGDIGCLLVEPLVGREGVLLPPPGWLAAIAECCRRHQILFIADEIFTGLGRVGHWFAVEAEGVRPDLLCCGKSLAGGLPLAAVVGRAPLLAAWATAGEALHTATFVANPVACAAALAVLELLVQQRLPERSRRLGRWLERRLGPLTDRFATVREVRGRGLLWGVELDSAASAERCVRASLCRGLLVLASGPEGRVLQLIPPLTIRRRQLEAAFSILEEALAESSRGPKTPGP